MKEMIVNNRFFKLPEKAVNDHIYVDDDSRKVVFSRWIDIKYSIHDIINNASKNNSITNKLKK